jgi:ATP-dependent Clp protease adaptor protein ClpS
MMSEKPQHTGQVKKIKADLKDLVLFNDDHNTFDFVIKSLVDICRHDAEQAEQCALITHLKGKCTVNFGSWYELKPQHDQLSMRGLSVSIT